MSEDNQALSLNWVFGTSTTVKNNIVNLSDGFSERICYVAAHTAVIYDQRVRRQIFLQGHCNAISCLAVTEDRSIIITADVGNESLLVLWNSKTGTPIRSIPHPHAHGIVALDIAPDGDWIATVSAPDPASGEQEIALWSMAAVTKDAGSRPAVLTSIPTGDVQIAVRFNMNKPNEIMTNGKRRVYFWTHQYPTSSRFKYYSPPLRSKDFKQSVGDFVVSVFVPGSMQALTATTDGDLVVWDEQGITAQMGTRATDRRAVKLMRIHHQPITYLSTIGDYVVSGGKDGFIRFYDPLLRIVAWFEDLGAGPITGMSFSSVLPEKISHAELADTLNRFMVPDFVVSTEESKILAVQSSSFEEFDASKRQGKLLLEPLMSDVIDVATHPTRAEFAVLGKTNSLLQRWDLVTHTCVASRSFPKLSGTQVAYSRDGAFMVVGFETGFLYILSTQDLSDIHIARNTPAKICMVATSTTGEQIAAADENHHVLLYSHLPYKHTMRWEYVGKAQAHHGNIVGLNFGETPAGQTRLFSLGNEGRVCEYDINTSTPATGLKVVYHQDFPAPLAPSALAFAPPLQYFKHHSADTLLLITDDAYKIKVYNPDLQAPMATFLGPTFGGPINQLIMFKSASSDSCILAYATSERVVGLIAWPMDGDPANTMGLIAHPGAIRSLAISYDGRKLLTAGVDGTLSVWDISTAALEAAYSASQQQGDRWAKVLGNPELLNDMKDYFYYSQIKAQGENSMAPRNISGKVPPSMVPDLMRAAGYYPSEDDIANIMHHINFIAASRDLDSMDDGIDFQDLLCLYINHRPLFDVSQEDIAAAFKDLGAHGVPGKLGREQLLGMLQQLGEAMMHEELLLMLQALTGADKLSGSMPTHVDAIQFSSDVLGFEDVNADVVATVAA